MSKHHTLPMVSWILLMGLTLFVSTMHEQGLSSQQQHAIQNVRTKFVTRVHFTNDTKNAAPSPTEQVTYVTHTQPQSKMQAEPVKYENHTSALAASTVNPAPVKFEHHQVSTQQTNQPKPVKLVAHTQSPTKQAKQAAAVKFVAPAKQSQATANEVCGIYPVYLASPLVSHFHYYNVMK